MKTKQPKYKALLAVLTLILLLSFAPVCHAADNLTNFNTICDWAETTLPDYFSPMGEQTFEASGFLIRYYQNTDTYVGTINGNFYVLGGAFGNEVVYVGTNEYLLSLINPPDTATKPTFITRIGHEGVNFGTMKVTLAVTTDGNVVVGEPSQFSSTQPIHYFNYNDGNYDYLGPLTTTVGGISQEISGDTFILDTDGLHTYTVNWGRIYHSLYSTPLDSINIALQEKFASIENTYWTKDIARDHNGNHYVIPCGTGTNADGRHLFLWKVNNDFSQLISSLDKEQLKAMLPGGQEANDDNWNLKDIEVMANGDILICVDLSGDNNHKDGILVLDTQLNKKAYIGGDWRFNDPHAVAVSSEGYIYVANTWDSEIVILDSNFQTIGNISIDNSLPVELAIRDNRLYVVNSRDNQIYVYEIY